MVTTLQGYIYIPLLMNGATWILKLKDVTYLHM